MGNLTRVEAAKALQREFEQLDRLENNYKGVKKYIPAYAGRHQMSELARSTLRMVDIDKNLQDFIDECIKRYTRSVMLTTKGYVIDGWWQEPWDKGISDYGLIHRYNWNDGTYHNPRRTTWTERCAHYFFLNTRTSMFFFDRKDDKFKKANLVTFKHEMFSLEEVNESLCQELLAIQNVEVRKNLLEQVGIDKLMKHTKVLDTQGNYQLVSLGELENNKLNWRTRIRRRYL
ncbi:MAG TPA: hypothetical protein VMV86_02840 [Methanosarcinales archaeon]|nr:hypothetical protein [Methanosarcinales archaeon]